MQITQGRIPMNENEHAAVDRLIEEHGQANRAAYVTRSEPGNTGPLLVQIGRKQWLVTEAGRTREAN